MKKYLIILMALAGCGGEQPAALRMHSERGVMSVSNPDIPPGRMFVPGDLTGDGFVDFNDLHILWRWWLKPDEYYKQVELLHRVLMTMPPSDEKYITLRRGSDFIPDDGVGVNLIDFAWFARQYGRVVPPNTGAVEKLEKMIGRIKRGTYRCGYLAVW